MSDKAKSACWSILGAVNAFGMLTSALSGDYSRATFCLIVAMLCFWNADRLEGGQA